MRQERARAVKLQWTILFSLLGLAIFFITWRKWPLIVGKRPFASRFWQHRFDTSHDSHPPPNHDDPFHQRNSNDDIPNWISSTSTSSNRRRRRLQNSQESSSSSTSSSSPSSICSLLPPGQTASSIWRRHEKDIFQASMHLFDRARVHRHWTRSLLQLLSPRILQRGIRVTPALQPGSPWDHVMTKLVRKLQHPHDDSVPPVQIAVFGGSVTEGRDCNKMPIEVNVTQDQADTLPQRRIIGRGCSWPYRLQWLFNRALQHSNIVVITNLAVGGTNSYLSMPIIQHWLYPEHSPLLTAAGGGGVDVIINAYATNDNLPQWNRPRNTTIDRYHTDVSLYKIQDFLKTCRLSQPCQDPPPLVLYMDDYVGNQANVLLGETQVHDMTQEIGRYGDGSMGHVSSMDALWRPFILPNTNETLFSPKWKEDHVEVHFGMPGHAARAWIFAYALLQWTVEYCHDRPLPQYDASTARTSSGNTAEATASDPATTSTSTAESLPVAPTFGFSYDRLGRRIQKMENTLQHESNHYSRPYNLKQSTLTLAKTYETLPLVLSLPFFNITNIWKSTVHGRIATRVEQQCEAEEGGEEEENFNNRTTISTTTTTSAARQRPCSFAFVAAPMGTHANAKDLNMYVARYAVVYQDWRAEDDVKNGWQNKLGVVARKAGARMVLQLPNITTAIKVVTLHYLKSYGDKWQDSTANFTFSIHRQHPAHHHQYDQRSWQLQGFHDQETSISYPHTVDTGRVHQAQPGDTVNLEIELVGGSTFKILSLLLCNR